MAWDDDEDVSALEKRLTLDLHRWKKQIEADALSQLADRLDTMATRYKKKRDEHRKDGPAWTRVLWAEEEGKRHATQQAAHMLRREAEEAGAVATGRAKT